MNGLQCRIWSGKGRRMKGGIEGGTVVGRRFGKGMKVQIVGGSAVVYLDCERTECEQLNRPPLLDLPHLCVYVFLNHSFPSSLFHSLSVLLSMHESLLI